MLELSDITVRYGPFLAVDGVSLQVNEGEIVGLVGPNGAGKSSLVKTIGGSVLPKTGRIVFGGRDLAQRADASADRARHFHRARGPRAVCRTCRSKKTC